MPRPPDYQLLSHRLDEAQPTWPGEPGLVRRPAQRMAAGDMVNTHVLELYTHYGTHCDLPYHFLADGLTLDRLDHREFIYHAPRLVDLPLRDEELVTAAHLAPHDETIAGADLLLLRSGFEAHRGDITRYTHHGPGFSDDGARHLRQRHPGLRAVALDWLSLASYAHAGPGQDAHRTLLSADPDGRFVVIFEDVRLSTLEADPVRVFATPLFIDGLEGSPCTILAETA